MKLLKSSISLVLLYTILVQCTSCSGETYMQGKRLYAAHCANCHMDDGTGLAKLIPPLAGSDYLKLNQEIIPCILRHGQDGSVTVNGVTYNQEMPPNEYTEVQITNIINYINHEWGNDFDIVNLPITTQRLKDCNDSYITK